MSNANYDTISKIDDLVRDEGKEGLQLLVVFKTLKNKVVENLKRYGKYSSTTEDDINEECMQVAKKIVKYRESLTESDIRSVLDAIKNK